MAGLLGKGGGKQKADPGGKPGGGAGSKGANTLPDAERAARWRDLVERAKRTNVYELAAKYSLLRKVGSGEWAGPCPSCGGVDRLHVTEDGFFCRSCKPFDKGVGFYSAIDWIMWREGRTFVEAVKQLTGEDSGRMNSPAKSTQPSTGAKSPVRTVPQTPNLTGVTKPLVGQTDAWRAEATPEVERAQAALFVPGNAGAAYLEGRGLEPGTWRAFGWGFGEAWYPLTRQLLPAIVIPWYRAGQLQAIRYRYLSPPAVEVNYLDNGKPAVKMAQDKLISRSGSKFGGMLYGGQALEAGAEQLRTLVLCEGEINAASIWQVCNETRLDVLSLGSESAQLTDSMLAYIAKFKHVLIWMDKREVADKWLPLLPPGSLGVTSPLEKDSAGELIIGPDGQPKKIDPNDLLRIDMLGRFMVGIRRRVCKEDKRALEGLMYDLMDGSATPSGLDAGSGAALLQLAASLGKPQRLAECPDGQWRRI